MLCVFVAAVLPSPSRAWPLGIAVLSGCIGILLASRADRAAPLLLHRGVGSASAAPRPHSTSRAAAALAALAALVATALPTAAAVTQTAALLAFKNSLTAGQAAVADWTGTVCTGVAWSGVECIGTDVVALDKASASLAGPLAPEFSALTAMTKVSLHTNALTGTIPAQLSTMVGMAYLYLYYNALTGTFPAQLSTWTGMLGIAIGGPGNSFAGTIPAQLSTWTGMSSMHFDTNAFTGTIPAQLSTMTGLGDLRLDQNNLVGSIPTEFSVMTVMTSANFKVYHNVHLCGTLTATNAPADATGTALGPACSSQLLQTVALMAFRDRLTAGQAAVSTWNMADDNPVCTTGGAAWAGVTCSGTNVVAVARTSASLAGPLAQEFSALTALSQLDLGNNALTGTLPLQFSFLTSLVELRLGNNALTGTVPPQLSELTSISRLKLTENKLIGSIPLQLTALTALTPDNFLVATISDLCGTYFGANAPANISGTALGYSCSGDRKDTVALMSFRDRLTAGQSLLSTWNMASGDLACTYGSSSGGSTWSGVECDFADDPMKLELDATGLNLGVKVPGSAMEGLSSLSWLSHLKIKDIQLTGTIPPQISTLYRLTYFGLIGDSVTSGLMKLTGTIPPQLSKLTKAKVLSLTNWALTGTIPPQLSTLQWYLSELNLSSNALTGTIPSQISTMKAITYLWLRMNKLVGSIPSEFAYQILTTGVVAGLNQLTTNNFNVDQNVNLCGTYTTPAPTSIAGTALGNACSSQLLQTVALMTFRDRLTAGQAAVSTWNMSSGNPMCGGTAWTGVECSGTNVVALDRKSLGLAGPLAPEFSALTALTVLALSENALTGTIPAQLSTLASLTSLSLWSNALAGTIPAQLSTLASLKWLGLLANALTGTIPAQLSTITSLKFLGFNLNALTGTIPAQLSTLASLTSLTLHTNALTGTIPAQLSTLASLTSLALYNNKLVGSIPAEFSVLSALGNFRVETNAHLCGTYTATNAPADTTGTALG
eukprot:CAMPEP_0182853138 /NCGR_PEP_ID=MMETSP0034_2-20130328/531_1 /TAXON_ID=156128 /ORGANISM="Nephroselmis pyriformis, Strain CCMP717" /LENGTH=1001 /DNA_ID=CAMNT_0024983891 /DNA_START=232 /DNA_END=3233 /DNA_ORIENTATION=+